MLHEGNALGLETFALFAHPDAYRSIPSHRSTWGICVEEGEEVLVVLFGFLSVFFFFFIRGGEVENVPASGNAAPQQDFISLVGFESMSEGENSQTPAATQIQKPWEIQGWVDLRSSLLPN